MNVAVVGAANHLGLRLVRDLAEHPDVEQVTAIDEHSEPIEEFIETRDLDRAEPIEAQVVKEALVKGLAGSSIVIGTMADPDQQVQAARASIEVGATYVATTCSEEAFAALMELDTEARDANVGVLAGMGISPGIGNLLAIRAADEMKAPRKITIAWTVSATGLEGASMFDRVVTAMQGSARIFRDSNVTDVLAGTESQDVFFPAPIGWRRLRMASSCEALTIPRHLAGLEEVTVKAAITEAALDLLARSPLSSSAARMSSLLGAMSGQRQTWSAIRADVWGEDRQTTLAVLDQTSNLISVPVIAACLLIAKSGMPNGVRSPEEALDPQPFFDLMAERGVRVARLIT